MTLAEVYGRISLAIDKAAEAKRIFRPVDLDRLRMMESIRDRLMTFAVDLEEAWRGVD